MRHARQDYNDIQDPRGLIPENEPVFLLRAQDVCAPGALEAWIHLAEEHGASKAIISSARRQQIAMCDWQVNHTFKTPDIP